MAEIDKAIISQLTADAGVLAQVARRIYPNYDRQMDKTYPLAVYKLELTPLNGFDGPTGVETAVLEIAAIAETYDDAATAAAAIRAALDWQHGTWAGVVVQGCFIQDDGERDDVIVEPTTEEILYHVKLLRFDLTFNT